MPKIKITKKKVDDIALPPIGSQVFYRDTELSGFGLRVSAGGTKTYILETRIDGKSKRITIGKHGPLTPEQARKQALKLLGEVATGIDPIAEKRNRKINAITLDNAYKDYLQSRKNLKPATLHDYNRCIQLALKSWLNKPITSITKDMVEDRHRELGKSSPARANNTMRVLRAVLNFSIERYEKANGDPVLMYNPVDRLSKTRAWYVVKRRRTLLTPTQLAPWYAATIQLNQETTRDYLHFVLFTGLRRSEAMNLTWDNVNFSERTLLIPDTKNNEPHTLPLSDYLENLLKRRQLTSESKWVFPSPITDGPLKEPRTAIERVTDLTGINFTLHDLRRTFITVAESLDIPAFSLKRLLNHKFSNDVTAGYIVPSTERLREPMQKISNYMLDQMEAR